MRTHRPFHRNPQNQHNTHHNTRPNPGFTFAFFSRAYLSRLAVALFLFLASAYLCALASMVAGYRTPYIMILDLDGRYEQTHYLYTTNFKAPDVSTRLCKTNQTGPPRSTRSRTMGTT